MRESYEVVIVGARVAGSTLAALLGEAGISVLLTDRARFPSTTCSTHFFRGGGMVAVLERLGVLDSVLELGSPPLTRELTYVDGGPQPTVGPPQDPGEIGFCLSVRREPLDLILTRRAAGFETVELAERTTVTDLLWDAQRVIGVRLDGNRSVRARLVVGADGRHSLVARRVQAVTEEEAPAYRALYYRYVTGLSGADGADPDAPEFSYLGDEIAYVFPSDSGMTCVALSVNLETFRWLRRELEPRFAELLARHDGLAERVAAAEGVGRLLGCGPERSYVRVPYGEGWALVGDAALHQDPWTGRGIDMAGVHATFLADAVVEQLRDPGGSPEALATYHRRRNAHALELYRETVRLAADLRAAVAPA